MFGVTPADGLANVDAAVRRLSAAHGALFEPAGHAVVDRNSCLLLRNRGPTDAALRACLEPLRVIGRSYRVVELRPSTSLLLVGVDGDISTSRVCANEVCEAVADAEGFALTPGVGHCTFVAPDEKSAAALCAPGWSIRLQGGTLALGFRRTGWEVCGDLEAPACAASNAAETGNVTVEPGDVITHTGASTTALSDRADIPTIGQRPSGHPALLPAMNRPDIFDSTSGDLCLSDAAEPSTDQVIPCDPFAPGHKAEHAATVPGFCVSSDVNSGKRDRPEQCPLSDGAPATTAPTADASLAKPHDAKKNAAVVKRRDGRLIACQLHADVTAAELHSLLMATRACPSPSFVAVGPVIEPTGGAPRRRVGYFMFGSYDDATSARHTTRHSALRGIPLRLERPEKSSFSHPWPPQRLNGRCDIFSRPPSPAVGDAPAAAVTVAFAPALVATTVPADTAPLPAVTGLTPSRAEPDLATAPSSHIERAPLATQLSSDDAFGRRVILSGISAVGRREVLRDLYAMLAAFGPLESLALGFPRLDTGLRNAYASFESASSARRAIENLRNVGGGAVVYAHAPSETNRGKPWPPKNAGSCVLADLRQLRATVHVASARPVKPSALVASNVESKLYISVSGLPRETSLAALSAVLLAAHPLRTLAIVTRGATRSAFAVVLSSSTERDLLAIFTNAVRREWHSSQRPVISVTLDCGEAVWPPLRPGEDFEIADRKSLCNDVASSSKEVPEFPERLTVIRMHGDTTLADLKSIFDLVGGIRGMTLGPRVPMGKRRRAFVELATAEGAARALALDRCFVIRGVFFRLTPFAEDSSSGPWSAVSARFVGGPDDSVPEPPIPPSSGLVTDGGGADASLGAAPHAIASRKRRRGSTSKPSPLTSEAVASEAFAGGTVVTDGRIIEGARDGATSFPANGSLPAGGDVPVADPKRSVALAAPLSAYVSMQAAAAPLPPRGVPSNLEGQPLRSGWPVRSALRYDVGRVATASPPPAGPWARRQGWSMPPPPPPPPPLLPFFPAYGGPGFPPPPHFPGWHGGGYGAAPVLPPSRFSAPLQWPAGGGGGPPGAYR